MIPEGANYEICVSGHLDQRWTDWFDGMNIKTGFNLSGSPVSVLYGRIIDQAGLHGILVKIRDIGIPIISVNRVGGA